MSDDYSLSISAETSIRIDSSNAIEITGGGNASYTKLLRDKRAWARRQYKKRGLWGPCGLKQDAANIITLVHDSAAVAPANRLALPGGRDLRFAHGTVELFRGKDGRWRVVG